MAACKTQHFMVHWSLHPLDLVMLAHSHSGIKLEKSMKSLWSN